MNKNQQRRLNVRNEGSIYKELISRRDVRKSNLLRVLFAATRIYEYVRCCSEQRIKKQYLFQSNWKSKTCLSLKIRLLSALTMLQSKKKINKIKWTFRTSSEIDQWRWWCRLAAWHTIYRELSSGETGRLWAPIKSAGISEQVSSCYR